MTRVLFIALVICTGCVRTNVRWKPYSLAAPSRAPIVSRAVEVYQGDLEHLMRAGGEVIGTLQTSGNRWAYDRHIMQAAAAEAAARGGTHFFVSGEASTSEVVGSSTQLYGNTAYTQTHHATFLANAAIVIRVERERLASLPLPLQPINGVHYGTIQPPSPAAAPRPQW